MNIPLPMRPEPSGRIPSEMLRSGCAWDMFERFVSNRDARVLDVGFGNGFFLSALKQNGYTHRAGVEANDYSTSLPGCDLKFANICYEGLPWEDGAFDAVTAWEVMEHLENPHTVVREIHRVLREGGVCIVSMPNLFHVENRIHFFTRGDFWRWTETGDNLALFTHALFKNVFLRRFTLLNTRYCLPTISKHYFVGRMPGKRNRLLLNSLLPANEWFGGYVVYVLQKPVKEQES